MPASQAGQSHLVLRPYAGLATRDGGFAHIEGLVMRSADRIPPTRYGDLDVIGWLDCARTPHHDRFRLTSQIDEQHSEAYAVRYGYAPENGGDVFTTKDWLWARKSLATLTGGMQRLAEREGRTEDLGTLALRLVRVLRLDGIVLLEPRGASDTFRPHHPVLATGTPASPDPILAAIRAVIARLHDDCGRRCGRRAA